MGMHKGNLAEAVKGTCHKSRILVLDFRPSFGHKDVQFLYMELLQ